MSSASTRLPTPQGLGSVVGAPDPLAGFTDDGSAATHAPMADAAAAG
jgi:hypothetical protein